MYEKFRGSNSHALVATQFICVLNFFLGRKEKTLKNALTELYKNLTVGALTTPEGGGFSFVGLTEICGKINIMLNNLIASKKIKERQENEKQENKLKSTYELAEGREKEVELIADTINIDTENITLKLNSTAKL